MSTLPGQASKGEKTKSKFQSLDINNLYRVSRGENTEKQTQKSSSVYIKHGMQSLGKVPSARRPPANLPSLKSEHNETGAAVPLVPPGGPGWGKQDANASPSAQTNSATPPTNHPPQQNLATVPGQSPSGPPQPQPPQLSSHQAAIALPVTTTIPPQHKPPSLSALPAATDKLWSSVMAGSDPLHHPPPYQSPQFQHEFPSLSAGDGVLTRTGSDAPYPSGLSLRPQTEGSWTQGGVRPPGAGPGPDGGPPRPNSAHPGVPPQLSAQAGQPQQQPLPPQFRGVIPPFMYKGSFPQNAAGPGHPNQNMTPQQQVVVNGRQQRPPRLADAVNVVEEVVPRPIIKEEELSRMDDIGNDIGWAIQDEVDYNQKLAFSDDESESRGSRRGGETRSSRDSRDSRERDLMMRESKHQQQQQTHNRERERRDSRDSRDLERSDSHSSDNSSNRNWGTHRNNSSGSSRGRSMDEEDIKMQRRTQQEVEIAVQRAKQRKEEEEKRFIETTKQGAAKKLMELEEKIHKRDRVGEGSGTINPAAVPPKPINHVEIPLPDFQKEKDSRETRARTPQDVAVDDQKSGPAPGGRNEGNNFRHLTQIEGKNFPRNNKHGGKPSADNREQNGPFSRHFQNDLPPRFQRNNANQPPPQQQQQQQQQQPSFNQYEKNRWTQPQQQSGAVGQSQQQTQKPPPNVSRNSRDSPDNRDHREDLNEDRREYKRQGSDEVPTKSQDVRDGRFVEEQHDNSRHHNYDYRRDHPVHRDEKKEKPDEYVDHPATREDWHKPDNSKQERYERPQRPDSRDSRGTRHSRESRDSEPREFGAWSSENIAYEDKRRDNVREDRRLIPGPITKDRIEADDMRNEKRNLTQLKRGQVVEKKPEPKPDDQDKKQPETVVSNAWADSIPAEIEKAGANKFAEEKKVAQNVADVQKAADTKPHVQEVKKTVSEKSDSDYKSDRVNNQRSGNRAHPVSKGWGNQNEYHRSSAWPKRPQSTRSQHKPAGPQRQEGFHATDSEGSAEEQSEKAKKLEKEEKNRDIKEKVSEKKSDGKYDKRDNYVPRGEPSRHGRGGMNNFNRNSRMSGMSKRIDGYGPPPKSPFGHHDEKDKKVSSDEAPEPAPVVEDKTKLNQQALAAGIIGSARKESEKSRKPESSRRGKSRTKTDASKKEEDTNSENSDEKSSKKTVSSSTSKHSISSNSAPPRQNTTNNSTASTRRNNPPPPRMDKRYSDNRASGPKKDDKLRDQNMLVNAIHEMSLKSDEVVEEREEKVSVNGDTEGFQEVKSKKTGKDQTKPKPVERIEEKPKSKPLDSRIESNKEKPDPRNKKPQLTPQQIQNIPSLMATPINPPPVLPKSQFERPRQNKLAPRFMKAKIQKQQQQHAMCEVNDPNKVMNQNINVYSMKEQGAPPPCAWDKPLNSQMRTMEHDNLLGVGIEIKNIEVPQNQPQGNSPNAEKVMIKSQVQDKTLLDGATPPVNTIIFENTNFKSAPGSRNARTENKPRKMDDNSIDISSFNKPISELIGKDKSDSIQLPMSFKEDNGDIKLDFFDSDLSNLTDESKTSKNLCMPKSMHTITSGNSTICTANELNIKIASVKKVWESDSQDDGNNSFGNFGSDSGTLDPNVFSKSSDAMPMQDDAHEGYSQASNQTASTTTNVCKVKPTQQVSGGSGQAVMSSAAHQPHSGMVPQSLMGNPLSPPPMQHVPGAGVGLGQPPQQFTANQHIGYQAGLGASTQYGMPAIPSPPTVPAVLYNSTQPLQPNASLYGAFQIDQSGVLGGQARSQFSQYPSHYGLGQTAASPYSTQSVYLQTAPPHPPPTAQAPPDLYQNYRLSAAAPFGQSQQLNNPTTVLISSTSNTLMSASVKPSSQQISAIGTKAGGVGQAYPQQSQQGQQVYAMYDPSLQQASYLSNAGVMQRGPAGPVQNNVVQALQPSSSYYSGSSGGQTGYFQQGNSTMPSAQLQQHQAGYGLQGNVFGTHNQTHTNAGLPNYNYLSTQMQVAAALSAQQFRQSGLPAGYMKNVTSQQMSDQSGRPQQLKSPGTQEALSSVFSGSQIPSPKSRPNTKHPPPQSSPTAQHKYNLYQGMNQQSNVQRYPTPIQRPPINYQQNLGSTQQNNVNQKHRSGNLGNKAPNRYYSAHNNTMSSQNEKVDDSKMNDNIGIGTNTSNATKASNIGGGGSATAEIKDKEDKSLKN